ncbi:Hypothetical protein NTJ_04686 [Nesidiocoris tenuis]|uniref:Chaperone DnaJ C-terminal domain-containing protein n=1 Tax=Nesidiocoris tenuis TaxID=355587 RepID=A0ABN7AII7_9HEMI|nr:Hypothetical protein NTJ_04686 [Nesidiocoris tenuis]
MSESPCDERLHVYYDVPLSLEDVAFGTTKTIKPYITLTCIQCRANNWIEPRKKPCLTCHGSKIYLMINTLKIHVEIGTKQGDRCTIARQGSLAPRNVRGNVIVCFLDQPHDYILRANSDVIVAFKIDRIERSAGVTRLLKANIPDIANIVIKTQNGIPVEDNSMWFVPELGLTDPNNESKGRLIVLFLVRSEKSKLPIKLTNLLIKGKPVASVYREPKPCRDPNDFISKDSDQRSSPQSTERSPSKETENSPPSPKKKKFAETQPLTNGSSNRIEKKCPNAKSPNLSTNLDEAPQKNPSNPLEGLEEFTGADNVLDRTKRHFNPSSIPDLCYLPFEDRIVCTGALPMRYKWKIPRELSIDYIEYLWSLRDSADWQDRVLKYDSVFEDENERIQSLYEEDLRCNRLSINRHPEEFLVFDVKDDSGPDDLPEAACCISTGFAEINPGIQTYTLTKMNSSQRQDVITSFLNYYNVPDLLSSKDR